MVEGTGPDAASRRASVEAELAAWRAGHPRATLTEIEGAVEGAVAQLRAQYLAEAIAAAAITAEATGEGAPVCPHCGGRLQGRGRQTRAVLVPGLADPLPLERAYTICAGCGAGVFPPG